MQLRIKLIDLKLDIEEWCTGILHCRVKRNRSKTRHFRDWGNSGREFVVSSDPRSWSAPQTAERLFFLKSQSLDNVTFVTWKGQPTLVTWYWLILVDTSWHWVKNEQLCQIVPAPRWPRGPALRWWVLALALRHYVYWALVLRVGAEDQFTASHGTPRLELRRGFILPVFDTTVPGPPIHLKRFKFCLKWVWIA